MNRLRFQHLPLAANWCGTACLWLSAAALLASGCGRATYERRMEQTIAFGKYREKLNQNLAPVWPGSGVEIRVPRQFVPIAAPPEPEEGDESAGDELPDPRQPDYMSVPLPGLIGAWRGEVDLVDLPGKAPAYMYVLSNYDMWAEKGRPPEEILNFHTAAANAVVDGLKAKMPEDAEWVSETHPRGEAFVPANRLTAAIVKSTVPFKMPAASEQDGEKANGPHVGGSPNGNIQPAAAGQVDELPVNCKMFLAEQGDIRVVVVFVIPEQVDPRENLSLDTLTKRGSRVALCLETLAVSGAKPSPEGSPGAGGGRGAF